MWCALFLLPPATFATLPVFSSTSLIYSPPLLALELMCRFIPCALIFIFFHPSPPSVHDVLLCFRYRVLCVYLHVCHFHQPLTPVLLFFAFYWLSLSFFSPSEIRCCHSPYPLFFFITPFFARYFSSVLRFDTLSTLSLTWIFSLSLPLFSSVGFPPTETRWYSRWAVQHCGFLHV